MSEGWWEDFQSVTLFYVMRLFLEETHTVLSELQFPSSRRLRAIKLTEGGLVRQLNNLITSSLWCSFTCRSHFKHYLLHSFLAMPVSSNPKLSSHHFSPIGSLHITPLSPHFPLTPVLVLSPFPQWLPSFSSTPPFSLHTPVPIFLLPFKAFKRL